MILTPGKQYRLSTGERVEFAYTGALGLAIVHSPGEPDMQSCIAVDPLELRDIAHEPSRYDRKDVL